MPSSRMFRFGSLLTAGGVLLAACSSDPSENAAATDASTSGGQTGNGGATATGGRRATGGAATGGTATGGTATGGSATGGAATGGAATGGSGTGGTGTGGTGTGGSTADASTDGSSGGTPADASGSDGSNTDGAAGSDAGADGASSVPRCGSSPYARIWVSGSTLLDHPTGAISVSGTNCSGNVLSLTPKKPATAPGQTGIDAQFLDVPDKTPFHLRATQTGSFPLLTQEVMPDKDSIVTQAFGFAALVNAGMVATDSGFDTLDPSWNASSRAILLLQISKLPGSTGNCADTTGITVTVDGHSEATGQSGATPILTASGVNGTYVFVTTTGTPSAAELLTLTLTKTGCTVKTTGYESSPGLQTSLTGKYPVEAGAVTWGLAVIGN